MPSHSDSSHEKPASSTALALEKDLDDMKVDVADAVADTISDDDDDDVITPGEVKREVRDFVRAHERRRRQFPRAFVVGLLTGLIAVAFRGLLDFAENWRDNLFDLGHQFWWGLPISVLFCALVAGAGVALVPLFAPETSGSGIPHLKSVLHRLRPLRWRRVLPVKFGAGFLAIGAGLTLGREGPTVQMGGAIGQMVSEKMGATARERQNLIAAGAGAGLAAAFNAPLAGLVFVLEEVQRDFAPGVFAVAFVACVTGDVVSRLILGQLPVFHTPQFAQPPLTSVPLWIVLGVLAGGLGVVFNRALLGTMKWFTRARSWKPGAIGALVGGALAIVAFYFPGTAGSGHVLVENTLAAKVPLAELPFLFIARLAMTMTSYATGAAGGIFAPLLVLGAQIGLAVGEIGHQFMPDAAPNPATFAVVGMAAYFTAIVRAPLTGLVLIVEMTGNYNLMLPLLIACFTAYVVADALGDAPIYEALLKRDLVRAQEKPHLAKTLLLELTVAPDAPFDGQRLGDLKLPAGCVVVTIERGEELLVASPDLELEAGDRFSAIIAPEAASAVVTLREGAGGGH